ncbi:hypothetical protein [Caldisphaera sp.]|nr:hypothetical protein [Caldisphaera sp.]
MSLIQINRIDNSNRIEKNQWIAILSSSITMFIWGFVLALAPVCG